MRNLNALIIEGVVDIAIPKDWMDENKAVIFVKNDFGVFEVVISGENIVKYVKQYGFKDCKIRLVGKLIQEDGRMKIMAEHIEFKLSSIEPVKE